MSYLLLTAWAVTRILFLALWYVAYPIGTANVWLKRRYLRSVTPT